ncbi:MAG: heparinase II/III-family protein [Tannerella sp.]|jgi:hypothetical protein|nr:heparinase II/III-family protein [Tannerella sp.]
MMRLFYLSGIVLLISTNLFAAEERNLLENSITKDRLSQTLAKGTEWVSFPAYHDRQAWESLPVDVRAAIVRQGEEALQCNWPVITATDYLEFMRSGDRITERPQGERMQALRKLAMAELIEGKGRFIDPLVNGVWAVCEQSTWVASAHLPLQKINTGLPDPDDIIIDLTSGDVGAMLSWIHYFFAAEFDRVSPLVSEVIRRNIRTRILEPYYARNDFWWLGFREGTVNNWNVWVNHNVMQCILLIETDHARRTDNIYKTMRSIDRFINFYPDDGGCDEGPTYWGHAGGKLFEGLELLYLATNGNVNVYENELIKNIGRYIYRAYIGDPFFVNFADAGAKGGIRDGVVYRYGKAIGDEVMQGFGAFYAQKRNLPANPPGESVEASIRILFDAREMMEAKSVEPLIGECWLPGTQYAAARDRAGSRKGFFFAAKGGYNDESHNHNDVGTCILYYNGTPVLIDVGVGTYTRQTFSDERYSIWTMQSGYHNLPAINGADQKYGKQYAARKAAFKSSAGTVEFSVDIAGAYPEEANVKTWKRSYTLQRGKSFTVGDRYELTENNGGNSLHFMTSCRVSIVKPGIIVFEGDGFSLEMSYNASKITARTEEIELTDNALKNAWGNRITRLQLNFTDKNLSGSNSLTVKPKTR